MRDEDPRRSRSSPTILLLDGGRSKWDVGSSSASGELKSGVAGVAGKFGGLRHAVLEISGFFAGACADGVVASCDPRVRLRTVPEIS